MGAAMNRPVCGVQVLIRRPCRTRRRVYKPADLLRIGRLVALSNPCSDVEPVLLRLLGECEATAIPCTLLRLLERVGRFAEQVGQGEEPRDRTWTEGAVLWVLDLLAARSRSWQLPALAALAELWVSARSGELQEDAQRAMAILDCDGERYGFRTGGEIP